MTIFISPSAGGDNACEACHHTDRSCFALRCSAALDRQTANYRRTTKYDCSESARLRRLFEHQCRDGSLARQPVGFCGLVAVTAQDAAIAMNPERTNPIFISQTEISWGKPNTNQRRIVVSVRIKKFSAF